MGESFLVKCGVQQGGGVLLSRVSTLTRDIDIAILSVRPSVCPSVRLSVRDVTFYRSTCMMSAGPTPKRLRQSILKFSRSTPAGKYEVLCIL